MLSNVNSALSSVNKSIKDAANPFGRLVNQITADDGNQQVPYYLTEEVKDNSFQSEYACQSTFHALIQRLEVPSPLVKVKTLVLIRILLMEGAESFTHKMEAASHFTLNKLANADTRKDTFEDQCKTMSIAILAALKGDKNALSRVVLSNQQQQQDGAPAAKASISAKSAFQTQQEKELKAFRKRTNTMKQNQEVVTTERVLVTFDANLSGTKLVQSAVTNAKKKFVPEELASFVSASEEKIGDVSSALDQTLRDGRQPLHVRYKVLSLIQAVLESDFPEALQYFRDHPTALQRHTTIDQSDNPTKAQQCQDIAKNCLEILSGNANSGPLQLQKGAGAAGVSANNSFASPAQQRQPKQSATPKQQPASPQPPAPQGMKAVVNVFDDLFGTPTPAPAQQQQQQQRAPPVQQQPPAQQSQWQQQPQQSQWQQQPQQNQWQQPPSQQPMPSQPSFGSSGSEARPPAPQHSWDSTQMSPVVPAYAPQQQQQQYRPPAQDTRSRGSSVSSATQPSSVGGGGGGGVSIQQILEQQQQMMQQMMALQRANGGGVPPPQPPQHQQAPQQQQQQPVAAWQPNAVPPPAQQSPPPQQQASEPQTVALNQEALMRQQQQLAAQVAQMQQQQQQQQQPVAPQQQFVAEPVPTPPPSPPASETRQAPQPPTQVPPPPSPTQQQAPPPPQQPQAAAAPNAAQMEMMRQLQEQMRATQDMLANQQRMFLALQQQFGMQSAPPQ